MGNANVAGVTRVQLLRILSLASDLGAGMPHGHSLRVSQIAERLARRLELPEDVVRRVRIAALAHDLGVSGALSFVRAMPAESVQSRAGTSASMPSGADELEEIAFLARLAHQGPVLAGSGTPAAVLMAAGTIAAATRFDELTHDAPSRPALEPAEAARVIRAGSPGGPFGAGAEALGVEFAAAEPAVQPGRFPRGLTLREVEVLRHLARGCKRRQIADQ